MADIVDGLRKVKQDVFNEMVEGNGRQPAEVVDMVVYAIQDHLPADVKTRLWPEVLNFYPDYEESLWTRQSLSGKTRNSQREHKYSSKAR